MDGLLWVAIGSALGGISRFWLSGFVGRRIGETFPWGTMAVNVTGAVAIGMITAIALTNPPSFDLRMAWPLAVTGFLGSYTTVSSFSLQTLMLARDGEHRRAAANIALSILLCLGAVALGYASGIGLSSTNPVPG